MDVQTLPGAKLLPGDQRRYRQIIMLSAAPVTGEFGFEGYFFAHISWHSASRPHTADSSILCMSQG